MPVGRWPSYLILGCVVATVPAILLMGLLPELQVRWDHVALHSAIKALGALSAILIALVLLGTERDAGSERYRLLAAGFLGAGILHGFQAASSSGQALVLLESLASLVAGSCFVLIWLPQKARARIARRWLPLGVTAASLWAGSVIWVASGAIPPVLRGGEFTPFVVVVNVLAGLFLLFAALRFILDFHRSRDSSAFLFACLALLLGTTGITFEYCKLWHGQWWFWHGLRLAAFVLALAVGVRRYLGMVVRLRHSLSEQERAEAQLRQAKEAAEIANRQLDDANRRLESMMEEAVQTAIAAQAASQSKSAFLAGMSHEIRTPLTAVLGYADVLRADAEASSFNPETRQAIETIHRNGEYLLQIVNDILDLSKIEAGKVDLERVDCSPCEIIADVISLMRVQADAKGTPLHAEYVGPIPERIRTDPTRLRQILINLVSNSIKFTAKGSIRILTQMAPVTGDADPRLQIDVIDAGIGMTQEHIARLFQPFTQADPSTTRYFGGTGLGLVIGKRLAELLDGELVVESQPGVGSTFRLRIATGPLDSVAMLEPPFKAAYPLIGSSSKPMQGPDRLDCHVLLAEDQPDNQRLISFILERAGAEVTVVDNGRDAVEKALAATWRRRQGDPSHPFDVILMDMEMPVTDGYEATRMLRSRGYTGAIIALTAHAMASDRQKCLDAGCDDYATKPIDQAALLRLVRPHARVSTRFAARHSPQTPPTQRTGPSLLEQESRADAGQTASSALTTNNS